MNTGPFRTGGGSDPHHSGGRAATSAVEPASVAASAEGTRVVRITSLPVGSRFRTLCTNRLGRYAGPAAFGDGAWVGYEGEDEATVVHGALLVEPLEDRDEELEDRLAAWRQEREREAATH